MSAENEQRKLEHKLERYRELLHRYRGDDATHETLRDYIAELERQLRDMEK
jgi:hypothetical protein